nr:phage portal protein [Desulfuromonadales bacterium]
VGDSPIMDVREAIGLEIAAEKMGSEVFGNLAMPGPVFGFEEWSAGFKTDEERQKFIEEFQAAYGSGGRWRPMVLPRGMTLGDGPQIDNDKAQYLQLRQYQRSVIAGAFGVPLHLVGDLSKGTFNNVSEQNRDLIMNVILPYIQVFEAALERALLTDADRNSGVIIRFDLDAALRADFKTRQEGLKIRREMGTLTANEWREKEGDNPLPEGQGGDDVWRQGPSGQNAEPSGDKPPGDDPAANDDGQDDEEAAKRRAATVARIQLRAASNVRGGRVSRALAGLKTSIDQYTEKTP